MTPALGFGCLATRFVTSISYPISATPQKMVETMLELAGVGPGDVVYDLGCNDGRVCITAARDRGARGVGVEIDQGAVDKARRLVRDAPAASSGRS